MIIISQRYVKLIASRFPALAQLDGKPVCPSSDTASQEKTSPTKNKLTIVPETKKSKALCLYKRHPNCSSIFPIGTMMPIMKSEKHLKELMNSLSLHGNDFQENIHNIRDFMSKKLDLSLDMHDDDTEGDTSVQNEVGEGTPVNSTLFDASKSNAHPTALSSAKNRRSHRFKRLKDAVEYSRQVKRV